MAESRLSNYTAPDGENLVMLDWPQAQGRPPRGLVFIVHGLGEHAGRYEVLAERLNSWGFAVRAHDQYGHGESDGERGALTSPTRLLDDLADILDSTRRGMDPELPLILLGHSLGGLVAARLVSLGLRPVDGLVLSSPAFDAGLNAWQRLMIAVLSRIAPNQRVRNGLDPKYLSHDDTVVRAYREDPLVHDRISARLARFIADTGPAVLAQAPHWRVPTLLMYAGADRLVNPRGSRAFAAAAPQQVVSAHCFSTHYHEIFNERSREPVLLRLQRWLDTHFRDSTSPFPGSSWL